jgi:hypothetical protein
MSKVKIVFFLLAGSLVAMAAWLVQVPNPVQADDIPEKYRDTVRKGLEFLIKNQHKDGHWEGDDGSHPVAMTGLVGIALLMEGNRQLIEGDGPKISHGKHVDNLWKAVNWLNERSKARLKGPMISEHPSETGRYMEGHGLATMFLAGALRTARDDKEEEIVNIALRRAVSYIASAQSSQGGWYHTSKVEGHDLDAVAATVIQIQALEAAAERGFPVSREVVNDALEYMRTAMADHEKGGVSNRSRYADTAAAYVCRNNFTPYQPNWKIDEPSKGWLRYCHDGIKVGPGCDLGRDELMHYYYAQALMIPSRVRRIDPGAWNDYRTAMFDHLQKSQDKDGGWPAANGLGVGRLYATAVWCIVMQLDNGSHPAIRWPEDYMPIK